MKAGKDVEDVEEPKKLVWIYSPSGGAMHPQGVPLSLLGN